MDVLGAAFETHEIAWWENTEAGFVKHSIDDEFDGAVKVHAADINGDGYLDVVGAGNKADEIAWWKNDGHQNFAKQEVAEYFNAPLSVFAADIDGDDDTDVVSVSNGDANKWNISGWFQESENLAGQLPLVFAMSPNYPNPFNPTTTINYQLPVNRDVTLIIYNLLGQKVETLGDGRVKAGCHSITWDASRFASGIYFYRLTARQGPGLSTAGDQVITRRMTLLK